MHTEYQKLIALPIVDPGVTHQIAESPAMYHYVTERHIQALWFEQKYFRALTTVEGLPIQVISPGIWNHEAGPDFLKAHLLIGDQEYRGDIELHLSEGGWYHHRHHLDPNYDNVILHISYWENNKNRPIMNSKGLSIQRTYLKKHLTIKETKLTTLIDLDLYPYQFLVGSGDCAKNLFQTLSQEKTIQLFRSASMWRLEKKSALLFEYAHDQISPFIIGVAMALGYKNNTAAFRELFFHLLSQSHLNEKELFAYTMGKCGFFTRHYQSLWGESKYYSELAYLYSTLSCTSYQAPVLNSHKVRPSNHPIRRLALLNKLCRADMYVDFTSRIIDAWDAPLSEKKKKNAGIEIRNRLLSIIPQYQDVYWEKHYTFELDPQPLTIAMIGEDLRMEILVNVILPILYSEMQKRNEEDLMRLQVFFQSLPGLMSQKSKYLAMRFFGDSSSEHIFKKRSLQQGAYQLHHDFCIHFEASCVGCPFVERYTGR